MDGIIGLIGNKGAGKSTVAQYFVDAGLCVEYAFADPLKEICMALGVPHACVYGTQAQKESIICGWGVSGRQLMQTIGTELFRQELFNHLPECKVGNVWLHAMAARLMAAPLTRQCAIISDVRFDDEADFVRTYAKEYGGFLLRIVRDPPMEDRSADDEKSADVPTRKRARPTRDPHASEQGITCIDNVITIRNNGTLEDLYAQLDDVVRPLLLQLNST